MKAWTKRVLVVVFWGILFFLPVLPAQADSQNTINSLTGQISLLTNGTASIDEVITYAIPTPLNWPIFSRVSSLTVTRDGEVDAVSHQQTFSNQTTLKSPNLGTVWEIKGVITTSLIRHNDRDQLFLKIFENPGIAIYNTSITFNLPDSASSSANDLNGNAYSIGGTFDPQTITTNSRQLVFTSTYAGPQSLFTISANWSKNVLQLTPYQELRLSVINLDILPWVVLGIFIPLIVLVLLLQIYWRVKKDEQKVQTELNTPPSSLAPILVGVLVNKKIYSEEIVSMLVDLCQRGYLLIVKKNNQYYLTRRRPIDEHLAPWEQEILNQIFSQNQTLVDSPDLQVNNDQALFNPYVRDAFARIYQVITELQFFKENPHLTRIRYKVIALFFYFLAILGIIWTAISGSSGYLLIPLIGTMLMAYLIIRLSPQLIRYTATGMTNRQAWLAFGNFLASDTRLPLEFSQNQSFERYLAYAIALHQTQKWARRFDESTLAIIHPDWFVSFEETTTVELTTELVKFTETISKQISSSRGPLVN